MLHDRSKHIQTRYHYIRECANKCLIKVDFVRIEDQLEVIFTKSLSRVKFEEFWARIGVQQIK
jgi:hypothetical protein